MAKRTRPSRRSLLVGIAAAVAAPTVFAQAARRSRRVGVAFNGNSEGAKPYLDAFVLGMDEQGYRLNRDYALEVRYALGRNDRYPAMMGELLRADSEVIVVGPNTGVEAAKAATPSVPIVMAGATDPEATGLVASLSRPGGNVTGLAFNSASLSAKRLQLLQDVVPGILRITYLMDPKAGGATYVWRAMEDAAKALALQVTGTGASTAEELDQVLAAMPARRADALMVGAAIFLFTHRARIIDFCARHRIPAIYSYREAVTEGGLVSYAAELKETFRKAAAFVARILNGAKPADLPVEQPTRFELFVNMKTADALGITISKSVLARADEVIR
jgi:putative ABC transport system substrate-binding protein